jgi:hypothetical protein
MTGIGELRDGHWGAAVEADGVLDPAAQVADLTGSCAPGRAGTG